MTPEIITYLICLLTFAYLAVTVFTFVKNRRQVTVIASVFFTCWQQHSSFCFPFMQSLPVKPMTT